MVAVPPEVEILKPEGINESEETPAKGLPNSLTPRLTVPLPPVLSLAQSQSLGFAFLSIWPVEQTAPSGLISPKKAMSPEMEAVPENDAPPTTSNAVVRSWVPI